LYIYLSNENPTIAEVYFDDLSIKHVKSPVIQYNDYYAYGLQTGNSWTRDNTKNNFLYNEGSEQNPTSGNYDHFFRNYDPALARFVQVDPLASKYHSWSTYNYAYADPVYYTDPSGAGGDEKPKRVSLSDEIHYRNMYGYSPGVYGASDIWYAAGMGYSYGTAAGYAQSSGVYGPLVSTMSIIATAINLANASGEDESSYILQGTLLIAATWNPYGGGMITKEEWLMLGGRVEKLVAGGKYKFYSGAWEQTQGGSGRFFTNEGDAYRYMWNSSFDADGKVQQEVAAFLTSKGVLVLPTEGKRTNGEYAKNGPRRSYNDFLPLSRKDGNIFVTFNGAKYQVLGQVHTHPNAQPFGSYEVASDLVTQTFLGVPVYMIRTDGFYNTRGTVLGTQLQFFNGTKSLIGGK
jgi:RHS repeat-associated protein